MVFKPLDPSSTLLFDIEAGGLSGYRSSILSIAHQKLSEERGTELLASPAVGSWISQWSENRVWSKIRRLKNLQKEQEILTQFLHTLEEHSKLPGATLAGFNIGYQALAQNPDDLRMRGFDISMIMTRAKRYGLEERYSKAFKNVKIRDVGAEWAARISEVVSRHSSLVEQGKLDKDLYQQAIGYRKLVYSAGLEGASFEQQARYMTTTGYKFAGWKQESIYELMGLGRYSAHMAGEDVSALRRMLLSPQGIEDEEKFVTHWNKLALTNKLTATARFGGKSLQEIQEYAQKAGLQVSGPGGLTEKIEETAKAYGASLEDVAMGRGMPERWSKVVEEGITSRPAASSLRRVAQSTVSHVMRHKTAYGIGIGTALLLATKPFALISGKDDDYNTIEGLRHGGMGERMRHLMTEFGSGWVSFIQVADDIVPGMIMRSKEGREMINEMKVAISNEFSGKDDEYNTIEGMNESGLAARLRKKNTDFGSGWDALRKLVRAGESFTDMLAGKEFQVAIQKASKIETFAAGEYGQVSRMAGEFRGQRFEFARKTALPGHEVQQEEISIMKELQEKEYFHSPSLYGHRMTPTGQELDMELFQGTVFAKMGPINETARDRALKAVEALHAKNVEHLDLHTGNVMMVKTPGGTSEVGIIDYGFARRFTSVPMVEQQAFGKYDIGFFKSFVESQNAGLPFKQSMFKAAKAGIAESAVDTGGKDLDTMIDSIDTAFDEMWSEPDKKPLSRPKSIPKSVNKVQQAEMQRAASANMFASGQYGGKIHSTGKKF